MKRKFFFVLLILSILAAALFLQQITVQQPSPRNSSPTVFVGVDVAYEDINQTKKLVDEVSAYTNLFVIGCKAVAFNATKLTDVCSYLIDKGLNFMVFTDSQTPQQRIALENATSKWGDHFLGLYAFDELGGKQIDLYKDRPVWATDNYSDAENQYVASTQNNLSSIRNYYVGAGDVSVFSSDYAFYWFNYEAGYTAVFAEFGWNHSRQLNIALCRGAATAHNRDWGVMITWTYGTPPYLESGPDLYNDMVLAYENGAKYIIIFDSDHDYTGSVLQKEHFEAMKQFWQYAQANPRASNSAERVAYVLPDGYGYGFRGPNDKIWGLWEADNLTNRVCTNLNAALLRYGDKLDVIYSDKTGAKCLSLYAKAIFWNETDQSR